MNWLKELLCKLFGLFCSQPIPPIPPDEPIESPDEPIEPPNEPEEPVEPPEPLPPEKKYPKDNPKPHWMPRMVCDIIDLPFNHKWRGDWRDIEKVVKKLSLAGCDYIRIFATGWKWPGKPMVMPFKKADRKFDFLQPNPKWDEALKKFRDILTCYHMGLYIDIFDRCSEQKNWNPFRNNCNNIHGFYSYDGQEMAFVQKHWIDRILKCIDKKKDIVSLGNELRFPGEDNVQERKIWAERWGVGHTKHLLSRGVKRPICFSGSAKTAHKLHGYVSKEEHPELDSNYTLSALQIHGLGLEEHVQARFLPSKIRLYSYSDDGVGTNPDSAVPKAKRGLCEIKPDGSLYACTANTAERIKAIEAFIKAIGNVRHIHSIGFLPRDVSGGVLSDFKPATSANIYWKLAKGIWGVDIRRKY